MAASGDLSGGGGGGDDEGAMRDWEEGGRFSFEDSDRFEEDSLCSWSSEPESLCNNWRGWKKPPASSGPLSFGSNKRALSQGKLFLSLNDQSIIYQFHKRDCTSDEETNKNVAITPLNFAPLLSSFLPLFCLD